MITGNFSFETLPNYEFLTSKKPLGQDTIPENSFLPNKQQLTPYENAPQKYGPPVIVIQQPILVGILTKGFQLLDNLWKASSNPDRDKFINEFKKVMDEAMSHRMKKKEYDLEIACSNLIRRVASFSQEVHPLLGSNVLPNELANLKGSKLILHIRAADLYLRGASQLFKAKQFSAAIKLAERVSQNLETFLFSQNHFEPFKTLNISEYVQALLALGKFDLSKFYADSCYWQARCLIAQFDDENWLEKARRAENLLAISFSRSFDPKYDVAMHELQIYTSRHHSLEPQQSIAFIKLYINELQNHQPIRDVLQCLFQADAELEIATKDLPPREQIRHFIKSCKCTTYLHPILRIFYCGIASYRFASIFEFKEDPKDREACLKTAIFHFSQLEFDKVQQTLESLGYDYEKLFEQASLAYLAFEQLQSRTHSEKFLPELLQKIVATWEKGGLSHTTTPPPATPTEYLELTKLLLAEENEEKKSQTIGSQNNLAIG